MKAKYLHSLTLILFVALFISCNKNKASQNAGTDSTSLTSSSNDPFKNAISQPLVSHIYTADPSAHVFNGRIYIYNSHDYEAGTPENDNGDHFAMKDYHILSMDSIGGKVTDHGIALSTENIPWAGRQLWAPDAAYKNGKYFLYNCNKQTIL